MDLGGLLGRVVPDAITFLDRVIEQAQEQLKRDGIAAGGDTSPDNALASALGSRLARMIVDNDSSAMQGWPTSSFSADQLRHYDELTDRNSALAAALGACDCWGQHANCPFCDGAGRPGWVLPDKRLFASYVHPALSAVTNSSGSSTVKGA